MDTDAFDYELPAERIAQRPVYPRDRSRLLVLDRDTGTIQDEVFHSLPGFLRPGDLLVVNDTKVLKARLRGRKRATGGRCELLLLRETGPNEWEALARPARGLRPGTEVVFDDDDRISAQIVGVTEFGGRAVRFAPDTDVLKVLQEHGDVPLPPYIHQPVQSEEEYQTIYARELGSAAAPTAGLHFTPELIETLQRMGIRFSAVTLHIGIGTFRPIQTDRVEDHVMHAEEFQIPEETAEAIAETHRRGGRIVAVGTTTVRALESAATGSHRVRPGWETTQLFIRPGHRFQVVDALITNFHLPRSSLLVMVCAFAGREPTLAAYAHAVDRGYRFYSFGDAMLIL